MSQTTVNLGFVPKNREVADWDNLPAGTKFYKDNIVQFKGSSYICSPVGYDPEHHTDSFVTVEPWTESPQVLNAGWKVFASGNNKFTTGESVDGLGIDQSPQYASSGLITSKAVASHGSAFDISEYNKNGNTLATYATLGDALTAIPSSVKRGGMSIKFIQTSDNNSSQYVQYRYMGTDITGSPNLFLDTANWQGVDDEPTPNSVNLSKSSWVLGQSDITLVGKGVSSLSKGVRIDIKGSTTYRLLIPDFELDSSFDDTTATTAMMVVTIMNSNNVQVQQLTLNYGQITAATYKPYIDFVTNSAASVLVMYIRANNEQSYVLSLLKRNSLSYLTSKTEIDKADIDNEITAINTEVGKKANSADVLLTGNFATNKVITTSNVRLFDSTQVKEGDLIFYSFDTTSSNSQYIELLDSSNSRLSIHGKTTSGSHSYTSYSGYFVVPQNFSYARFMGGSATVKYVNSAIGNSIISAKIKAIEDAWYRVNHAIVNFAFVRQETNANYYLYLFDNTDEKVGNTIYYDIDFTAGESCYIRLFDSNDEILGTYGKSTSGGSTSNVKGSFVIPNNFAKAVLYCNYGVINFIGSDKSNLKLDERVLYLEGEIVDISILNGTTSNNVFTPAKYATFDAAIAALPEKYQNGGVTIKFINSSTLKYETYSLISSTWSTERINWQGLDTTPSKSNDYNVPSSKGVYERCVGNLDIRSGEGNGMTQVVLDSISIKPSTKYHIVLPDMTNLGSEFDLTNVNVQYTPCIQIIQKNGSTIVLTTKYNIRKAVIEKSIPEYLDITTESNVDTLTISFRGNTGDTYTFKVYEDAFDTINNLSEKLRIVNKSLSDTIETNKQIAKQSDDEIYSNIGLLVKKTPVTSAYWPQSNALELFDSSQVSVGDVIYYNIHLTSLNYAVIRLLDAEDNVIANYGRWKSEYTDMDYTGSFIIPVGFAKAIYYGNAAGYIGYVGKDYSNNGLLQRVNKNASDQGTQIQNIQETLSTMGNVAANARFVNSVEFNSSPIEIFTSHAATGVEGDEYEQGEILKNASIVKITEELYYMYYESLTTNDLNDASSSLRIAYSSDGLNWTRGIPSGYTGVHPFPGTNKLVEGNVHGATVFKVQDDDYPFRMVSIGHRTEGQTELKYIARLWKSADGINFTFMREFTNAGHDSPVTCVVRGNMIKVFLRGHIYHKPEIKFNGISNADEINVGDTYTIDGVSQTETNYMIVIGKGDGYIRCNVYGNYQNVENIIPVNGTLSLLTGTGADDVIYASCDVDVTEPTYYGGHNVYRAIQECDIDIWGNKIAPEHEIIPEYRQFYQASASALDDRREIMFPTLFNAFTSEESMLCFIFNDMSYTEVSIDTSDIYDTTTYHSIYASKVVNIGLDMYLLYNVWVNAHNVVPVEPDKKSAYMLAKITYKYANSKGSDVYDDD